MHNDILMHPSTAATVASRERRRELRQGPDLLLPPARSDRRHLAPAVPDEPTQRDNPNCSATPVTDGRTVWVMG